MPSLPDIDGLEKQRSKLEIQLKSIGTSRDADSKRLSDLKASLLYEIEEITRKSKGYSTSLSGLINDLNTEINLCKRKETLVERFIEEHGTAINTLNVDRTKVAELKSELQEMLRVIETL